MTDFDHDPLRPIESADWVRVDAADGIIEIPEKNARHSRFILTAIRHGQGKVLSSNTIRREGEWYGRKMAAGCTGRR
jgi:hypothetical protein